MSICAIVYVPDGIVMVADSRLTEEKKYDNGVVEKRILSDEQLKIHIINNDIGLTYHGDSDYDGKDINIIINEFKEDKSDSKDTVVEISFKLQEFMKENYPDMDIHFRITGYIQQEPYVIYLHKDYNERTNVENDNLIYCAECGGNVSIPSGLNSAITPNFDVMTLRQAINFAKFYIETTIKGLEFHDAYSDCGGPIDILVLTTDECYFYQKRITSLIIFLAFMIEDIFILWLNIPLCRIM